jgi:regulator of RNase E activity RraA
MDNHHLNQQFSSLSTPLVADACLRLGIPLRVAPWGIEPLVAGSRIAGRALPARHFGSVDVFLEAMGTAQPGDVLIVDNGGRMDEGPVGDLTTLEAKYTGLAGIAIWGCHRDTSELIEIAFPVFSYGHCPAGPQRLDPRDGEAMSRIEFGPFSVTNEDVVFADADGVVFAPAHRSEDILATARVIWTRERGQAEAIARGETLRAQLRFDEFLVGRSNDSSYSFRKHLQRIGGAIEE